MALRVWRFIALLLTALALGLTSAHVLEMPQKMQYDAALYSAVNTTMYRYFAVIGAPYSMGAIFSTAVVLYLVRKRRRAFPWALAALVLLVLWFASWITIVAPVNGQVAALMQSAPSEVPALWMRLRGRWELGHAVGFALELLGFCALTVSMLVDTPSSEPSTNTR